MPRLNGRPLGLVKPLLKFKIRWSHGRRRSVDIALRMIWSEIRSSLFLCVSSRSFDAMPQQASRLHRFVTSYGWRRFEPNAMRICPRGLRGVFVFESLEDAQAAAKRWDGGHFDPSFLSEIEMVPSRSGRLDSEWITFNLAADNDPLWMDRYWRGEVYGTKPLTEVICSGVGAI